MLQTTTVGSPAGQSDMDAAMERMALKSANDLISKYYLCPISPTNAQAFASADPENLTIRVAQTAKGSARESIKRRASMRQSKVTRSPSQGDTTITGKKI